MPELFLGLFALGDVNKRFQHRLFPLPGDRGYQGLDPDQGPVLSHALVLIARENRFAPQPGRSVPLQPSPLVGRNQDTVMLADHFGRALVAKDSGQGRVSKLNDGVFVKGHALNRPLHQGPIPFFACSKRFVSSLAFGLSLVLEESHLQDHPEFPLFDGLHDVGQRLGELRPLHGGIIAERRQIDDRDIQRPANGPRGVDAIHASSEPDVHEDQIGPLFTGLLYCFFACCALAHDLIAELPELFLQIHGDHGLIFDHQNVARFHADLSVCVPGGSSLKVKPILVPRARRSKLTVAPICFARRWTSFKPMDDDRPPSIPSGNPIPLSSTESMKAPSSTLPKETLTSPHASPGKACLKLFVTSSVVISAQGTAKSSPRGTGSTFTAKLTRPELPA